MTNAELKDALISKFFHVCDGIRYQRVSEIVYKMPKDELIVSAGLLDMNGKCLVYARAAKVERADTPADDAGGKEEA